MWKWDGYCSDQEEMSAAKYMAVKGLGWLEMIFVEVRFKKG